MSENPEPGWREEVKLMIALAISQFHGENVERLTKIDGTLESQNQSIEVLKNGQDKMQKSLNLLVARDTSWDKAEFWSALKTWIGIILALIGSVIGYLTYRAHSGHEVTEVPHAQIQPYNAGN